MKKLAICCFAAMFILSSFTIGWAGSDINSTQFDSDFQIRQSTDDGTLENHVVSVSRKGIELSSCAYSENFSENNDIASVYFPLTISPRNINIILPCNKSFSKQISIYNSNTKSVTAYISVKNKYGISHISVNTSKLSIPSGATKTITVSGTTPSSQIGFGAEIEIANNLDTNIETCVIVGDCGLPNQPTNINVSYDSSNKDYTITWDAINGMHHYNVYMETGTGFDVDWKLIERVSVHKYVRHDVSSRDAKVLKFLIRGVDFADKTGPGTVVTYTPDLSTAPASGNVRYSFTYEKYIVNWDPVLHASSYNVYIQLPDGGGILTPSYGPIEFVKNVTDIEAEIAESYYNGVNFYIYPIGPDGVESTSSLKLFYVGHISF
ncbi:hypothetical protein [Abyssisolibacter fermentans]|uniref:hypothetical protein n=1 Tax=Abyssisolibacter fermentans TaxID=1766203 RepID=UPI00082EF49E|nr:hypothetical protein [Abyssisolibacter fermentans]